MKLGEMLQERFRRKEKPKMNELAQQSAGGQLSVFSAIFGTPRIDEKERAEMTELLNKYADESVDVASDLSSLLALTSEVKAINNQAAILHGERIKKAQEILKKYREGAFTAWLQATYGNRQTPYNFLQYFDFYSKMPLALRPQIEAMPRQAVYTLASREGVFEKKEEIVRNYQGETKQQMITLIRSLFPLKDEDKRKEDVAATSIQQLERIATALAHNKPPITPIQRRTLLELLTKIKTYLD